ncbi:unnamed protein product, partial [Symbiodinium sp. KB8]
MAPGEGQQCFSELLRCHKELAGSVEALNRTHGGIKAALQKMPSLWPELGPLEDLPRAELAVSSPSHVTSKVEIEEKFQLTKEGVPTLTKNLNARKTPFAKIRTTGTVSLGKS